MNNSPLWDGSQKAVKLVAKCPICGHRYKQDQAKVIEEQGEAHLVHIQCDKCLSGLVAVIYQAGMGINSYGLVTDLTADDLHKFKNIKNISANDCLDFHQILESKKII